MFNTTNGGAGDWACVRTSYTGVLKYRGGTSMNAGEMEEKARKNAQKIDMKRKSWEDHGWNDFLYFNVFILYILSVHYCHCPSWGMLQHDVNK
jgi:hypothetical protein